jgi:RNA polymerase sigma factor (TIGR02999 family)
VVGQAANAVIMGTMTDASRILNGISAGDPLAAEKLLPLVYDELRRIAAARIASEKPGQTLEATALVHEAYVRLVDSDVRQQWNSRSHFFCAAAEAMRRILVERARHKQSLKRGGDLQRQDVTEIQPAVAGPGIDVLALNEALEKLELREPRISQLVKLRFFAGLTIAEAAETLGVSTTTLENDWAYGRSWLRVEIEGHGRQE